MLFSKAFVVAALPFLVLAVPPQSGQVHPPVTHQGLQYKQTHPGAAPPHAGPPSGPNPPHQDSHIYLSEHQAKSDAANLSPAQAEHNHQQMAQLGDSFAKNQNLNQGPGSQSAAMVAKGPGIHGGPTSSEPYPHGTFELRKPEDQVPVQQTKQSTKGGVTVHVPASVDHKGDVLPVQDKYIPATGTNTEKPHRAGPQIGKRELLARREAVAIVLAARRAGEEEIAARLYARNAFGGVYSNVYDWY